MTTKDNFRKLIEVKFNVGFDDISGKSRKPKIVEARKALSFLLRHHLKMSFPEIGEYLNRDHTSIIHLINTANKDKIYERVGKIDIIINNTINIKGGKWAHIYKKRGAICQIPNCGFNEVLEIHHLVSLKMGGVNNPINLIVLCPNHHSLLHSGLLKLNPNSFPDLIIPQDLWI